MARILTEDKTSVQVVMSKDAHAKLKALAASRTAEGGKSVGIADIIREAVKLYVDDGIDFGVKRGGNQRKVNG